jgi:hypothetical protein
MSFISQLSICRPGDKLTMSPTREEMHLSELVRPGMNGERHIKQILPTGKYAYHPDQALKWQPAAPDQIDVAVRRKDIVRIPNLIRIEGISWQQEDELDWTAYLPSDTKNTAVPVDEADDAGLGYYNCRILQPGDIISLNHRSIITDFSYHDDYFDSYVLNVIGSSLIEQHDFAHVDMPMNSRSGFLVIGRMDQAGGSLDLTAFTVRPGDNVYIPASTIHTNDYFLGTWQTLLSSACKFPNARIRKPGHQPLRFVHGHNH